MPLIVSIWLAIQIVLVAAMLIDRAFLEKISTIMWASAIGAILIGIYYLIEGPRVFAVIGAIGFFMIASGFVRVPEDPPHVGILTFWDRRLRTLLPEGTHLLAPYFPFMVGVNSVNVEGWNFKFEFKNVHCKHKDTDGNRVPGGQVSVIISGMVEPDYKASDSSGQPCGADRIITYLNRGGEEKVRAALEGVLQQATKNLATLFTWEDFTLMKAPLAAALIMNISGAKVYKLPRIDAVIPDEYLDISPDEYAKLRTERIRDPLMYLWEVKGNETEYRQRYKDVETFLKVVLETGVGDVVDLGIQFTIFAVEEIEPEDALDAAAQGAAIEQAERRKEEIDFDTELLLAEKYLATATKRGEQMTLDQALERVRVNRGRAKEVIVRSSGNQFADAAALMSNQ